MSWAEHSLDNDMHDEYMNKKNKNKMAGKAKTKKKKDPTFRVYAKVVTYCYHDITAKNATDAENKVMELMDDEELDAGDFIPTEKAGDFIVGTEDIPTQKI